MRPLEDRVQPRDARRRRRRVVGGRIQNRKVGLGLESLEERALLATGLVAAYDFGEVAGATVLDASGNGNSGTLSGAVRTTAGKYGGALSFNGTNAKVVVADSSSLHLTTAMTLEAWVRPTALSGWTTAVLKERPGGLAYALYASDNTARPPAGYVNKSGSDISLVGASALALNTWSHLATTYDGAALRLYVNGVLVGTRSLTGSVTTSTSPLDIGGNSVWGEYFSGLIDEVRVYNRALSVAEVQTDMNTPISAPPDTTPPVVSLTAPANNATVSGTVTLAASASDNVGVAGVQFLLNGNPLGAEDTAAPYSVNWDTTTAANATDTIAARARDAAGNLTTSTVQTVNVSNVNTDPAQVGQWSSVIDWPLVAVNSVLLKDGRVLMWDGGPECIGSSSARVWDPATGLFVAVPIPYATGHHDDIFCSGQAILADGRVLVVGGHDCDGPQLGISMTNIFNPATMTWTRGPDMNYRRWYPTATTLADGRVLVTAGSTNNTTDYVPIPEIYDPVANTWTALAAANKTIPNYPFVFDLPDGQILAAGSDEAKMGSYLLSVGPQTWVTVDPTVLDAGSAVMYQPGKIMKAGSSYLSPPTDNGGSVPSAATTYVLDTTQPAPAWQQTASMANPRTHLDLTILPDGNVLATGGSRVIGGVDPASAVESAELWSPVTQTWTTMASEQRPRMYHSTALLLPDGRVLSAGGGHNYFNSEAEFSAEIYSPAYLFKGPRPTVTSAPQTLAYGASFFVGTPDAAGIASVALIRNGSSTHAFDMDQRFVPLSFQVVGGGLSIDAPVDANLATPGTYMLFLVNANGVPSVAPLVRLPAPYEDTVAPTAPTGLTTAAVTGNSVTLNWGAASDNLGVVGYDVYRSTTSGFTPSAANRVGQTAGLNFTDTGVPVGTFYYKVTARDAADNVGPASAEASATVTGDLIAPTVALSSPANGAILTGSVTLAAAASDNVGVAGVQFVLDGVNLGAEDTTAPYSFVWNTAAATNGSHTLTATARDASGNKTTSATVVITVSNAAPTGLVGAWGFEEGTGTTTTDVSGHALNGTLANATWTAAGKFGNALSFNGTNAWVTVADNSLLHLTTGMTLEAWVRPAAVSTDWATAILKERSGGLAYSLYVTDGANKPPAGYINRNGTDVSAAGTSVLPLNVWTHVAVTYDGAAIRLYVNGALAKSKAQTGSINSSTGPLRFGGNAIWGEYFKGLIDEVRIYSRALSTAEIQVDMSNPVGGGTGGLAAAASPSAGLTATSSTVGAAQSLSQTSLTTAAPPSLVDEAIRRWARLGATLDQLATLRAVPVMVADLAGKQLGFASGGQIWVDRDAAGYGWFIDPTPADDSEFRPGGPAAGMMDLLTVLVHEMGHTLGFGHSDAAGNVMHEALAPGVRQISIESRDRHGTAPSGPFFVGSHTPTNQAVVSRRARTAKSAEDSVRIAVTAADRRTTPTLTGQASNRATRLTKSPCLPWRGSYFSGLFLPLPPDNRQSSSNKPA